MDMVFFVIDRQVFEVDRAGVKQAELVSTPLPFPGTQPTPTAGESLSLSFVFVFVFVV